MDFAKIFNRSLVKATVNGSSRMYLHKLDFVRNGSVFTRPFGVWKVAQPTIKSESPRYYAKSYNAVRNYSLCCPPRPPPGCGCPPCVPGGGRRIVPPADCKPGPIPPNPCCPRYHHGKDTYKKYKYFFFFFCVPLILFQMWNALGVHPPHKGPCREYEYMRNRSKRFPWGGSTGDGMESFFHNPHVNHLPGECEPPPLICDED